MIIGVELLHPDDVLFFAEVASKMKVVAMKYNLGLKSVGHLPDEKLGLDTDRWGDCDASGNIRMMMRPKVGGQWTADSLSPEAVWGVAAHELAHLRHYDHGKAHAELAAELLGALEVLNEDHREKVLRKLIKLQNQAASEKAIGNSEAAEAFASMVNKMLLQNELSPTDIDYARRTENDPVVEILCDLERYGMPKRKARSAWQERLASVVSYANLCQFLIRPGSNVVWMVGTKSHATVAEYTYGVLVAAAEKIADQEWQKYYRMCAQMGDTKKAVGFRQSWLFAFVTRVGERFSEERKRAIAAANAEAAQHHSESTALVRLDQSLQKVRQYIDDKFTSKKRSSASVLSGPAHHHADGRAWGRAAADKMVLGTRGLGSAPVRGLLK